MAMMIMLHGMIWLSDKWKIVNLNQQFKKFTIVSKFAGYAVLKTKHVNSLKFKNDFFLSFCGISKILFKMVSSPLPYVVKMDLVRLCIFLAIWMEKNKTKIFDKLKKFSRTLDPRWRRKRFCLHQKLEK
jgi:hypothetical protein